MSELGAGLGSSYPGSLDTDNTVEVNSPAAGKTKARAEVVNDLAAALVAVQGELGTDPAGTLATVKAFLQLEHGADGTHSTYNAVTATLTNKSLQDSTTFFVDNSDATKKLQFQVSGVTTGTTRTLTIPNFDGTIATLAGTETLTNKSIALGSNTITGTSAQLATAISDETGSGALVFATLPTLGAFNFGEVQTALMSTKKNASSDGFNIFIGGGGQSVSWDGGNSYTGSDNTVVGCSALNSLTQGYNNTAMGMNALFTLTTGNNNIAIGHSSLYALLGGTLNTAVGGSALGAATSGGSNIAVGYAALSSLTTGSSNVGIGVDAGNDALVTLTTQSNYVVIGNNSTGNAICKVAWATSSDARDKTDFGKVPHGIEFVNKLKPISYQYKTSREDDTPVKDGRVRYGFLAQDILSLEGDNPVIIDNRDKESLRYVESSLIPVLVKAIQELIEKVEILEAKI